MPAREARKLDSPTNLGAFRRVGGGGGGWGWGLVLVAAGLRGPCHENNIYTFDAWRR